MKKQRLTLGGFLTLFTILGMLFLIVEITFRALFGATVGYIPNVTYPSMMGYTSLWMILIGGAAGVLIGLLNEKGHSMPKVVECIFGTLIILAVEFLGGVIFNLLLGLSLWDYSNMKFNLLGQISLGHAVVWFFLCPFGFWADDQIRHYLFKTHEKYSLLSSYKKLLGF